MALGQACRTDLDSDAVSPLPKDKMAHDVKDQQYYGTPKQQADNCPVVRLALRFFHEAPKLYSWRHIAKCAPRYTNDFDTEVSTIRHQRSLKRTAASGGTLTNGVYAKLHIS
jgi:hypothetical protein